MAGSASAAQECKSNSEKDFFHDNGENILINKKWINRKWIEPTILQSLFALLSNEMCTSRI